MTRDQLVAALRELYVAHTGKPMPPFTFGDCSWCDARMAQVMEVVDAYAASLTGPPASGNTTEVEQQDDDS